MPKAYMKMRLRGQLGIEKGTTRLDCCNEPRGTESPMALRRSSETSLIQAKWGIE